MYELLNYSQRDKSELYNFICNHIVNYQNYFPISLSLVDVVDLDLVACCKKLHQYFKVTHLRYQYRFPNHFWEFLLKSNSIVYYAWNFRASISIFTNFINHLDNLLYYFCFFFSQIYIKYLKINSEILTK